MSFAFNKLLEKFSRLLSSEYNEICINEPRIIFLEKRGLWEKREEKELDFDFLNDFCIELANKYNQRFNLKNPSLSCSIPNTRFRVQALHGSVTTNGSIALSIRIPSDHKFNIDAFKKTSWEERTEGYFYQSDKISIQEAERWVEQISLLLTGVHAQKSADTTLVGGIKNVLGSIGINVKEKTPEYVTTKCIGCMAPITGQKGQTVRCKYCDTEQTL